MNVIVYIQLFLSSKEHHRHGNGFDICFGKDLLWLLGSAKVVSWQKLIQV